MLTDPGLYVHLPWCVRKCPYCDFNSHPVKAESDFEGYILALLEDWQTQKGALGGGRFATVFFGGGTPSLFSGAALGQVLESAPLAGDAEVTLEANPGTTEHLDFSTYREAGINRLSLGAQSFDDARLAALGRIHKSSDTVDAFQNARAGGFANINIDLMWGLPEQTPQQALADLNQAIALAPEHISWYQLTIEPRTEFARRPPLLPVEDVLADMEQAGLRCLAAAGYQRYEVSAFARPEYECRHNVNYWRFGDYLGIGAGAHGKRSTGASAPTGSGFEVARTTKPRQPRLFMATPGETENGAIAPEQLPAEFMMNALRLTAGVAKALFTERTGLPWSQVEPVWQRLVEQGLAHPGHCAATPLGLRYLDSVVAEFLT